MAVPGALHRHAVRHGTGRFVRAALAAADGLEHPIQAMFTDDGRRLLVTDNKANCVWELDLQGGRVRELVKRGEGGLQAPSAVAGRDGVLYVGSRLGQQVLKYDLKHGRFLGVFCDLPGNPEFLVPVSQQ